MPNIVNQASLQGAWKDQSIDKLEIFSEAHKHDFSKYSVAQPHPLHGVDPNIINEYGHTVYPKMIYPNGKENPGVVVNNAEEESEALGKPVDAPKPAQNNGWS